jgi:hypothetical protein
MTIIGSALRNDLDVHAYLEDVLRRVIVGETDWTSLSPHAWKTKHPAATLSKRDCCAVNRCADNILGLYARHFEKPKGVEKLRGRQLLVDLSDHNQSEDDHNFERILHKTGQRSIDSLSPMPVQSKR